MRTQKYYVYLDKEEVRVLLNSLVSFKNRLSQQGRFTDLVDEIIMKVAIVI